MIRREELSELMKDDIVGVYLDLRGVLSIEFLHRI